MGDITITGGIESDADTLEKIVEESIMSKKTVSVSVGPNNVHEILDEVRSDH